jgi:hypothetical protein
MKRVSIWDFAETEVVKKAQEFGIDLTLTEESLQLSPTERLRKLQETVNSIRHMREGMKHR